MGDIYLDLFLVVISDHQLATPRRLHSLIVLAKLLPDLKEPPFDLLLDLWLQDLLSIIHLKLLALKLI
jgi:hypothetical protein